MPKNELSIKHPVQPLNHLQTLNPRIMIPRQPTVRMTQRIILRDVELIARPDERPILFQIDLHDNQPGAMSRTEMQRDTLEQIQMVIVKGRPIQFFEVHVIRLVDAEVGLCGDGPARVLELCFVYVDGDVGAHEMFESAGVVQVQVADHDGFDVFDVVSRRFDRGGQFLFLRVYGACEDVGCRGPV